MAWRRPGDKLLSEPMMVSSHIYSSLGGDELNLYLIYQNAFYSIMWLNIAVTVATLHGHEIKTMNLNNVGKINPKHM